MNKSLLISDRQIAEKIQEMAQVLNERFANHELIVVGVLKGSVCLIADLIRHLEIPFQIEFVKASSYGMHGTKPKDLQVNGVDALNLKDKDVLLIDDIYDTGNTLSAIYKGLRAQNPRTLQSLVLLKKQVPQQGEISPTYVCFDIEDDFVVGYGLDYKEHFRGLKGIYKVST